MLVEGTGGDRLPLDAEALLALPLFAPLRQADRELCVIAYLASDRALLGARRVEGARDWVEVPARTVACDALALGAAQVVMAHNHPGGDPTPSAGDLAYTRRLDQALEVLGTRLFDHLVVAGSAAVSMRERGLL